MALQRVSLAEARTMVRRYMSQAVHRGKVRDMDVVEEIVRIADDDELSMLNSADLSRGEYENMLDRLLVAVQEV